MENPGLVSPNKIVLGVSPNPRNWIISSKPLVGLPNLIRKTGNNGGQKNSGSSFTVLSLFGGPKATKTIVPEKVMRDCFASIASSGRETSSVGVNPQLSAPPAPSHVGSPLFRIGVGLGLSALFSWRYAMKQAFETITQQMNAQNNPFDTATISWVSPFPFPPPATSPPSDSSKTSTTVASQIYKQHVSAGWLLDQLYLWSAEECIVFIQKLRIIVKQKDIYNEINLQIPRSYFWQAWIPEDTIYREIFTYKDEKKSKHVEEDIAADSGETKEKLKYGLGGWVKFGWYPNKIDVVRYMMATYSHINDRRYKHLRGDKLIHSVEVERKLHEFFPNVYAILSGAIFQSIVNVSKFCILLFMTFPYKFVLAIENTMTESYVTEKLFYALDSGAVPIYFGAPNVWDFIPPRSIIDGTQFSSLEQLASYVKALANDPVAYVEYHAWRRCGVLGNYGKTRAASLDTLACRVCEAVSRKNGRDAKAL